MMEHENGHHPYHTRIPNTIIKGEKGKGLSVYARWLYVYLKSVAGDDGQCFQSTTKLATESGLSRMSISRAKQELVTQKLITVTPGRRAYRDAESIRIKDIWKENMQEFSQCTAQVHQEAIEDKGGSSSSVSTGYSSVSTGYSSVSTGYSSVSERNGDYIERARIKKIPLRRTLEEEREDTPMFTDAVNIPPAPAEISTLELTAQAHAIPPKVLRAPKTQQENLSAQSVLAHLNHLTGSKYRKIALIPQVLNAGATVEECILVIDWLHTVRRQTEPEWVDRYLDPTTPFRPDNFDKYLAQAQKWAGHGRPDRTAKPNRLAY